MVEEDDMDYGCKRPPMDIRAACNTDYTIQMLTRKITMYTKMISLSFLVGILILLLIWYVVVQMYKIIRFWRERNEAFQDKMKEAASLSQQYSNTPNPANQLLDPLYDNEIYKQKDLKTKELAENQDDFYMFDSAINKSISEYKTYNENLKKYYKNVKNDTPAQDLIDRTMFIPEEDNYT